MRETRQKQFSICGCFAGGGAKEGPASCDRGLQLNTMLQLINTAQASIEAAVD